MNNSRTLVIALITVIAGVLGCSETVAPDRSMAPADAVPISMLNPCGDTKVVTLWAGQYIDAGSVTISNDADYLSIEIVTANGWYLTESHAAVARTLETLPQTGSGNPKVGHFDLATEHDPPVTSFTYEISIADYGYLLGDTLVLAVHAAVERMEEGSGVVQEETAWAEGPGFPGSSWATYLHYTIQECTLTPPICAVTVTYPNGGERICLGGSDVITWEWAGDACGGIGATVMIELLQYGTVCQEITPGAPNWGEYDWENIFGCSLDSTGYSIQVTDLESGASDVSDAPFMLVICGGGE
ncbi:MAG: hypothetical protein KAY32_02430 [Candidatus Eisenbacteria sp.]|nr:hypothetical protein [Candidatus Eisenbacteria bacterium]